MKIQSWDYIALHGSLTVLQGKLPPPRVLENGYKEQGLTARRLRWDLLWGSRYNLSPLYDYLNDSHIDTALRKVLKDIGYTYV